MDDLLTVGEVAEWLRFEDKTIREMCEAGDFEGAFKAGNRWRIPRRAVEDYIERQRQAVR
jgi:excisionase family DNA binding protein